MKQARKFFYTLSFILPALPLLWKVNTMHQHQCHRYFTHYTSIRVRQTGSSLAITDSLIRGAQAKDLTNLRHDFFQTNLSLSLTHTHTLFSSFFHKKHTHTHTHTHTHKKYLSKSWFLLQFIINNEWYCLNSQILFSCPVLCVVFVLALILCRVVQCVQDGYNTNVFIDIYFWVYVY